MDNKNFDKAIHDLTIEYMKARNKFSSRTPEEVYAEYAEAYARISNAMNKSTKCLFEIRCEVLISHRIFHIL